MSKILEAAEGSDLLSLYRSSMIPKKEEISNKTQQHNPCGMGTKLFQFPFFASNGQLLLTTQPGVGTYSETPV